MALVCILGAAIFFWLLWNIGKASDREDWRKK